MARAWVLKMLVLEWPDDLCYEDRGYSCLGQS